MTVRETILNNSNLQSGTIRELLANPKIINKYIGILKGSLNTVNLKGRILEHDILIGKICKNE